MIRRDSPRDSQIAPQRDKTRDSQKTQWDKGGIGRDSQARLYGINHPPYRGGYPKPTIRGILTELLDGIGRPMDGETA